MISIDKEQVKSELIQKNLFGTQRELLRQRRIRMFVMTLLLLSLMVTVIYGTLEDPIRYTLSNIGNFFDYRLFFIIWAILTGLSIQFAFLALIRLEEYSNRQVTVCLILSVVFLVLTALVPAIRSIYPFWHTVHSLLAGLHALFLLLSMVPFVLFVARENPRLRLNLIIWLCIIWVGGILSLAVFGHSALFELWFFVTLIWFLLYLSLVLFEEKVVKMSNAFFKDEENLNLAIEKIFVNLEKK